MTATCAHSLPCTHLCIVSMAVCGEHHSSKQQNLFVREAGVGGEKDANQRVTTLAARKVSTKILAL